jgi:poly-beta-1,6-N-acetyl-D-glucosamine synthase
MLTASILFISKIACISGIAVIVFAYLGFPLVLFLLSRLYGKGGADNYVPSNHDLPDIQVVISCYNEADIIEKRLANVLQQEYPGDKLSVLVISDGSVDGSDEIVRKISQNDPRVALFVTGANLGKNEAINSAFASGAFRQSLLCFTDADSEFEPFALASAARFFASPQTGLVAGKVDYWLGAGSAHRAEGLFWKLENFIREREGELGCLVSCPGQLIMMRRELFQPLPTEANTDFALPLSVLSEGYQTRFTKDAKVRSAFPASQADVLRRRKRTIIRALTTMALYWEKLPWHIRQVLFWHKTARFFAFPLQGFIWLANILLVAAITTPFWVALFAAQTAFYGGAVMGWLSEQWKLEIPLVHLPYQFTLQNAVAFSAVVSYFNGERIAKWTPPR